MPTLYSIILLINSSLFTGHCLAVENPTNTAPNNTTPAAARSTRVSRHIAAAEGVELSPGAQQLITLSTPREHFSALYLAANQAEPRGMLILLPGVGESFDWPNVIGPLRNKLPDAGWHTLSLNLPPQPSVKDAIQPIIASPVAEQIIIEPPVPALLEDRTETDEPLANDTEQNAAEADEPATDEALASESAEDQVATEADEPIVEALPPLTYPERIHSFIAAAIDYAQQQQAAEIVLLGHHEGAYWALNYPIAQSVAVPLRVVLVAARVNTQASQSYENLINANILPVADFYYKDDRTAQAAALKRLQASKRAGLTQYHQIGLTAVHSSLEQEQLFRRIKGWLNKP